MHFPQSFIRTAATVLRFPFITALAAYLIGAGFPLVAGGAGIPLTLVEAQRLAVERSRQVTAQVSAAAASHELAVAAAQLPDPVLRLGIENLPVDGPDRYSLNDDFMTMRRVGVTQEFTRAEKRQWRAQRFEREAEKSLADRQATIATIQRETALAWLDRYYAEAMAMVVARQATEAGLEITATEGAYRAGRGTQADVIAAHGARVALEDQASEFDRRIRIAKTMLARWAGGEAAEAPLGARPAIETMRLDTGALETGLADHPEFVAMAKREEVALAEARIAQADKKADWSVEVAYSQRGPDYSNMVSVGVSIPLQWDQKSRQDRELAARLAMAEQYKAEREESLRAHVAEVRVLSAEWDNARERLARQEREIVPLAQERTRATLAAYQGGKAGATELLAARRNELDARMQALRLEQEIARLWAQLSFLFPAGESR